MAGDWLKVEKATPRKPEVLRIASLLGVHPDQAFGLCFRFWSWCDDQLHDANARGVSPELVDALVERNGFANSLIEVGWLQARNGSLVVPNFDRHLSQSAKSRALTASRVAKHARKNTNDSSVSSALAREEKRRDRKKVPKKEPATVPELLQTPEFMSAWEAWKQHRFEIKSPLTPTTVVAQLKMLARMGPERAIATIEHTIVKGWIGLKEPDASEKPAPPKPPPVNAPLPPKRTKPVDFKHDPYATRPAAPPTIAPPKKPPVPVEGQGGGGGGRPGGESVAGPPSGVV